MPILKDISEFKKNDLVIGLSNIVYQVQEFEIIDRKKNIINSICANTETGELIKITHNKNKCFNLFLNN